MPPQLLLLAQICTKSFVGWVFAPDPTGGAYSAPPDPLAGLRGPTSKGRGKGRGGVLLLRGGEGRRGSREEEMGGERRKKEGKGRGKGGRGPRRGPLRILAGGPECEVTPLPSTHCQSQAK